MRMTRTKYKTYKKKIGKNHYLIIKIVQIASGKANVGNVLASNAANIQIYKTSNSRRRRRR